MASRSSAGRLFFFRTMSVIISGSIAYDTVFTHEGYFADTLRNEALDRLNVTLQAASMRRTFGGCAANIAYSLKQLGGDPLVWTAVGRDAGDYLQHFARLNIRKDGITVMPNEWTAQCTITTDIGGNQLATFSPGAMAHAGNLPWPQDAGISCGILAPSCRDTLLAHAKAFISHNLPFIFDPGQTTPLFSGDELLALTKASCAIAFSDYEALLIEERTGLSPAGLSQLTNAVFCTHGGRGSSVWQRGVETLINTPKVNAVDPVGAGDAYRGGLLWGMTQGLDPIKSAVAGSFMGATKAASVGPSYAIDFNRLSVVLQSGDFGTTCK